MNTPAIEVQHLSVDRGPHRILDDLSFDVVHGEILAVLGPNGAGKSTLLRAVAGLLPCSGTVRIAARPLGELKPRERARLLTFMPQAPSLAAPLPVQEVVAQGRYAHVHGIQLLRDEDRQAVEAAMRQADVAHLAARPFTTLSHGEKQRAVLARALCTGARILCLDEPAAALDISHALELYGLLRRLAVEGYAIMLSLHPLADALRFADRALLIAPGQPVRIGPVAEVIVPATVRAVYGVQMRHGAGVEFDLVRGEDRW